MLITFTHDFHSIKKGMGIYIKNDEQFPIKLCEETLSSERVRALEHLGIVEVVHSLDNKESICLDEVVGWLKQKGKLLLTKMNTLL